MLRAVGVPVELVLLVAMHVRTSPVAKYVVSYAVTPAVGADAVWRWRAVARIHSLSPTTAVVGAEAVVYGRISTSRRWLLPSSSASRLGQRGCAQLTHREEGRLGTAAPPAGRL
eukprot:scaffold129847_cov66-Phaeocystis_antarctica.AAC.2